MAATDQNYRKQKTLDIVFGVSCLLMLLSIVWMFAQDYYRDWKVVQRDFRDVDEAVTQRMLLDQIGDALLDAAAKEAENVKEMRANVEKAKKENDSKIKEALAGRDQIGATTSSLKANLDSIKSLRDIAVDERDGVNPETQKSLYNTRAKELERLVKEVADLQAKFDDANNKLEDAEDKLKQARKPVKELEDALADAEDRFKKLADPDSGDVTVGEVDRLAKALSQKPYRLGDKFRALPVIDGFASPFKIKQYTLEEYPIDYNFKRVTRYDRCTTCHLGMEQDKFSKGALTRLKDVDERDKKQNLLNRLAESYKQRKKAGESIGFDPSDLPTKVLTLDLKEGQINQFAVHPRLDLFVDSNSPHPAERFGCTSCHSGQGSATDFFNADHTPTDARQRAKWVAEHDWEQVHAGDWEYPMLPKRFTESGCLKCHHQVTDLIRYGSREEAPKVLRGYNLIKENGCFGCHEIAGMKSGVKVGPDLRLEDSPPLEALSAGERAKKLADLQNPPGMLRKVGPSLYRLVEKTNEEWVRRWIHEPRGFRPDTKMPHFYGLSNNHPDVLPADQKDFPSAEIYAISRYLMEESGKYLEGNDIYKRLYRLRKAQLDEKVAKKETLSDGEKKDLADATRRLEDPRDTAPALQLREVPVPFTKRLIDGEGNTVELPPPPEAKDRQNHLTEGARLFRERGCLACHSHEGTRQELRDANGATIPAVAGEANFGPNLTRLSAKLGTDVAAQRRWLFQWILNPNVYHPRTRMPITHLTPREAAQVADWLLSQDNPETQEWKNKAKEDLAQAPDLKTLTELARVWLMKVPRMPRTTAEDALKAKDDKTLKGLPADLPLDWDADERRLQQPDKGISADDLEWYIGRKAITRYGCFACHDVPGFEMSKPIGTPLNDWGKKDPERLAFEDIAAYVEKGHLRQITKEAVAKDDEGFEFPDSLRDDNGKPVASKSGKDVYEKYFKDALDHHQRDGFLHQKLYNPRSYDYHRERAWDDRLKMPQFKFARSAQHPGESKEDYEARQAADEADAREAVMTFVLGLVAEPVPAKYLNRPTQDRDREARGRQVLDKFNCAGCHLVQPAMYEFQTSPRSADPLRKLLGETYDAVDRGYRTDVHGHIFDESSSWTGRPSPQPTRLWARVGGVRVAKPQQAVTLRLEEAVNFLNAKKEPTNLRAGTEVELSFDQMKGLVVMPPGANLDHLADGQVPGALQPLGGTFSNLMWKYLSDRNSALYPFSPPADDSKPRAALPPSLGREGEKAQPNWLADFLRNPTEVRPFTVLRMPKFNMSDDEIAALVDYFTASDRQANPGAGVTYNHQSIPQRDPNFWREHTREYVERLKKENLFDKRVEEMKPYWKQQVEQRLLPAAEEEAKTARDIEAAAAKANDAGAVERAKASVKAVDDRIKDLKDQVAKNTYPTLLRDWQEQEAYATDAFRMIGQRTSCLECHQAARLPADAPKGPRLDLTQYRLRPDWTLRWVANPDRMLNYVPFMPAFFKNDPPGDDSEKKKGYRQFFVGTTEQQAAAVRDILMNFQAVADMPGNRYYHPPMGGK